MVASIRRAILLSVVACMAWEPVSAQPRFLSLPFDEDGVRLVQGPRYALGVEGEKHWSGAEPGFAFDYAKGTLDPLTWDSFDVLASARGVAMQSCETADCESGYGRFVLIRHDEVDNTGRHYFTLYAHLDEAVPNLPFLRKHSTNFSSWAPVERGTKIGRAGSTGIGICTLDSDCVHLHFEVFAGGYGQVGVDPHDISYQGFWATRDHYEASSESFTGCGVNQLWLECPPLGDDGVSGNPTPPDNIAAQGAVPVGARIPMSSYRKVGFGVPSNGGDNWSMTVQANGQTVTNLCDGDWLNEISGLYHVRQMLIDGDENFTLANVSDYPGTLQMNGDSNSWFGYGIADIDGTIYSFISRTFSDEGWSDGPFRGTMLLKTEDYGQSWTRINSNGSTYTFSGPSDPERSLYDADRTFFWLPYPLTREEYGGTKPAYPFGSVEIVQRGAGDSLAKDSYVYLYTPEGAYAHRSILARAPKATFEDKDTWEVFTGYDRNGSATWSPDFARRQPAHTHREVSDADPSEYFGWYSYLPSVVYNEPLDLYIMATGGTRHSTRAKGSGTGMTPVDTQYFTKRSHSKTGSLSLLWAENPWGPWTEFYYDEYWNFGDSNNYLYQPKLHPTWISPDGRKMHLVYSNQKGINVKGWTGPTDYTWNQVEITLNLSEK